jgi:hypothetical protein
MRSKDDIHLTEEQLIMAVVDEQELTGEHRLHLAECQLCNAKVEQFREELQLFGENSRSTVPPMTRTITLPDEEPASATSSSSWLPSFGAAVMAGLVLFFYFLGMETMSPTIPAFQSAEDLLAEEYLMDEIFQMVENPLSDELYQLTGDNTGFDEEFMEFVVPEVQEDYQSQHVIQGGIKQC